MSRYISTEIMDEVQRYNDNSEDKATLSWNREYLCLNISGRNITSGEIEVLQRLKVINRERGYQYF
jgi:hypothetical protein